MMCTTRWQLYVTFASMTMQNIWDHWSVCKGKHNKECMECDAHECHRKAQKSQDSKKELKSHKSKKASKLQAQEGAAESLRSGKHGSTKDANSHLTGILLYVFLEGWTNTLNVYTFFSWIVPHCIFEWTLAQLDKLVRASHSCIVLVFISCNYLGIPFCILY